MVLVVFMVIDHWQITIDALLVNKIERVMIVVNLVRNVGSASFVIVRERLLLLSDNVV